jgi:hypothetical protein
MRVRPAPFLALALAVGAVAFTFGPCLVPPQPDGPGGDPLPPDEFVRPGLSREAKLRIFAKAVVARDAAEGRLTLPEAGALFRELNRLPPAVPTPGPLAQAEEERLCRQVIHYARVAPLGPPGQAGAAARLEAELQVALQAPGGLRLPDAAALPPLAGLLDRAYETLIEYQRTLPGGQRPNRDL